MNSGFGEGGVATMPNFLSVNSAEDGSFEIEYEYEMNDNGQRVVLGRGSFGTVYSGFDMVTRKKMAIKEIPRQGDSDSG